MIATTSEAARLLRDLEDIADAASCCSGLPREQRQEAKHALRMLESLRHELRRCGADVGDGLPSVAAWRRECLIDDVFRALRRAEEDYCGQDRLTELRRLLEEVFER